MISVAAARQLCERVMDWLDTNGPNLAEDAFHSLSTKVQNVETAAETAESASGLGEVEALGELGVAVGELSVEAAAIGVPIAVAAG